MKQVIRCFSSDFVTTTALFCDKSAS